MTEKIRTQEEDWFGGDDDKSELGFVASEIPAGQKSGAASCLAARSQRGPRGSRSGTALEATRKAAQTAEPTANGARNALSLPWPPTIDRPTSSALEVRTPGGRGLFCSCGDRQQGRCGENGLVKVCGTLSKHLPIESRPKSTFRPRVGLSPPVESSAPPPWPRTASCF